MRRSTLHITNARLMSDLITHSLIVLRVSTLFKNQPQTIFEYIMIKFLWAPEQ